MATKLNELYARFLEVFGDLKSLTDDDPDCLSWRWKEDKNLESMISELNALTRDFERTIDEAKAWSPMKFFAPPHSNFLEGFDEYNRRYRGAIDRASSEASSAKLDELLESGRRALAEKSSRNGVSAEIDEAEDDDVDYWNYWTPEKFDPLKHDAFSKVELLFDYLAEKRGDPDVSKGKYYPDDPNLDDFINSGLGAWEYINRDIGANLPAISARLKKLPWPEIPRHVWDSHGRKKLFSVFRLLEEAHKAYVFGLPLAALAMCRPITEKLLEQHYVRMTSSNLNDLIDQAEERYPWIKRENLHDKQHIANDILHANRRARPHHPRQRHLGAVAALVTKTNRE